MSRMQMFLLPPATMLGQGYVFTGICHSVNRGGVPDQVHPPRTRYTPQDQVHPPGPGAPAQTRYTPQDQVLHPPGTRYTPLGPGTPPRTRYTPQDQVHPPRPGTPSPSAEHAGRYGQRAGGTHPTGMQSCCKVYFCSN